MHQRQVFEEAINSKMIKLIREIPDTLMYRHFEAFLKSGMRTKWFEFLCRYFNLYNYFGLKFGGDYKHINEIDSSDVFNYRPVRTIYLGGTLDGKFVIDLRYKSLCFRLLLQKQAHFLH
jgi:hypothetical protein